MLIAPAWQVHSPASNILSELRKKVEALEGTPCRLAHTIPVSDVIDKALPGHGLPLGCLHEVRGNPANVIAFAGLLSARIPHTGAIFYIEPARSLYPLGLLPYAVNLRNWVHIRARRPKDLAWSTLEALRCPQVAAVFTVMKSADLTFSRRLQLAAENSGATVFLFGEAASAVTRWRVSAARNSAWFLELLYCRNGQPGAWQVTWRNGRLEHPASKQMGNRAFPKTALAG